MVAALKIILLVSFLGVGVFLVRSGLVSHLALPSTPFTLFSNATGTSRSFVWQTEARPSVFFSGKWTPATSPAPIWQGGPVAPQDIPKGFTASQLSPYFHKVRIGSVSPGSVYYYGQVSLYASLAAENQVDVTGWVFQANRGSQVVPRAVNLYDPSGLAGESDIRLSNSDMLNIYSTQSAIGENLRMNKCIGYLENYNHFTPQLPLSCPYIDRSEIANFTGACQNVITSVGSCKFPPDNPLIAPTDYACKDYLSRMNYKGCFERHSGDADFLSHEWRAWAGTRFLDPSHDNVYLYDRLGLLVDTYSY